jgi:iron only hydrogenase large subunit-like protein
VKLIEFDKSLCDSCYKCLRGCPTKAISFYENTREIVDDLCIKCGLCQLNCPQNALKFRNPINSIMGTLKSNRKTAVSIAPSYVGAFDMDDSDSMAGALKALGFDYVEETSVGAQIVFEKYKELVDESDYENIITTCCPAANYYIESHYPKLIENMLPVVSPMIAHGRYMKEKYTKDCFVVFIGPCLAKMAEADETSDAIDAVITFDELQKWFEKENIVLNEQLPVSFDEYGSKIGKAYPITVNPTEGKDKSSYRYVKVDGTNQCKTMMEELSDNSIKGCLIEMNVCEGGCLNGPEMPKNNKHRYEREMMLINSIKKNKDRASLRDINNISISINRDFKSRKIEYAIPDNNTLKKIMRQMGKYIEHDELNCGACGYQTCYEKAIAIYNNRSDVHNCMAYLRGKAESISSNMIENSPNAVCTVNSELIITEHNPSFDKIFNNKSIKIVGMPIGYFADEILISKAIKSKKSIKGKKIFEKDVKRHFIINVIYYEPEDIAHVFFTDITVNELKKEELEKVKKETLIRTQEVIDKQMRVAQEIAGLLGETTAETKMSLKSLRDLLLVE